MSRNTTGRGSPAAAVPPPNGEPGRPHRLLRAAALSASASTLLLVTVGALVRATGSGEGCPGWPRCYGRWVPPFTYHPGETLQHALIEYSHRFTALLVFVSVVTLALVAWRRYRRAPRVFRPAAAALLLYLGQAALGGLVVKYGLTPWLVTAHLAAANLLVGTLVYATVVSFRPDAPAAGPRSAPLAWTAAGAVFLLIVVGALVRGEGAGLAFLDWPLMGGRIVPSLRYQAPALMFAHRVLALAVGALVAALAVRALPRLRAGDPSARLILLAAALFVAQVLVGAAQVWTRLAAAPVVAHVALSSLIWGALVAAATLATTGRPTLAAAGPVAAGPARHVERVTPR